jgi:DNA-binding transcriptional ArsR family regulator
MSEPYAVREITSSRVLRALSHPTRRRLLDVLTVDGPSTVSGLAERLQQAVGNISHHLKVMHEAGLVVEAPEHARDQRERWWQRAATGLRWSETAFAGSESSATVADAAALLNLEHQLGKVRTWMSESETAEPAWRDAAFATDFWLHLTPDELAELSNDILELAERWQARTRDRDRDRDREDSTPVFVFARGMPASP